MEAVVFHGVGGIRPEKVPEPEIQGCERLSWSRTPASGDSA